MVSFATPCDTATIASAFLYRSRIGDLRIQELNALLCFSAADKLVPSLTTIRVFTPASCLAISAALAARSFATSSASGDTVLK